MLARIPASFLLGSLGALTASCAAFVGHKRDAGLSQLVMVLFGMCSCVDAALRLHSMLCLPAMLVLESMGWDECSSLYAESAAPAHLVSMQACCCRQWLWWALFVHTHYLCQHMPPLHSAIRLRTGCPSFSDITRPHGIGAFVICMCFVCLFDHLVLWRLRP